MKPSVVIKPPQWMRHPNLLFLMRILNAGDMNARLVGGCIRNHLMGLPVRDIDIATRLIPDEVIERLNTAHIRTIPTGIAHGTVTALINGIGYEITTLRRDIATDGRRADVAFDTDWIADAARRDFTVNALYADCDGSIYDPLGSGMDDLQNHCIRFIGDPEQRIREDYLRILRFFRFYGRYGHGIPDPASFHACKQLKDGIHTLSHERIATELCDILSDNHAIQAVTSMAEASLMPCNTGHIPALGQLIALQEQLDLINIPARYHLIGFDKKYIKNSKINRFFKALDIFEKDWDGNVKRALFLHDRPIVLQGLMILRAIHGNIADNVLTDAVNTPAPVLPVTATDIMDHFHIDPGPQVGAKLDRARDLWIENNFTLNYMELLNGIDN